MLNDVLLDNLLNDKITDYSQIGKKAGKASLTKGKNLDHVRGISVGICSKEDILSMSHGEVLISETINYRTQRPERGGLFCEQIFGPRKNYECACGKYKRIRYKGIVCERCGVEVTTSQVRRQRMGHIELAAPVVHIWFLKSVPSRVGLLLDVPSKKLEQVVYFAAYMITDVYEDKKLEAISHLEDSYKKMKIDMQKEFQGEINEAKLLLENKEMSQKAFNELEQKCSEKLDALTEEYNDLHKKLEELQEGMIIGELDYQSLYDRFSHVFKGGTGAEPIKILLERINIEEMIRTLRKEQKIASKAKQKRILQKLKLALNLYKSNQNPVNFILEAVQVIPPDLRPMIQLDGGRIASSDLNDLYRRVINRNNRLKKLIQLGAPDVILKNEKRMLQESLDALISGDIRSSRSGYAMANRRKLKSLTDVLKGKHGRFRQNLLGKRVDYSGRSVIVVGPTLKIDECGLPKKMALTLFKPFVIGKLIEKEVAYNIKHAEKFIEEGHKEVWDVLEEVTEGKYVLLNRAPTLHRLGVQAFQPRLVEGKAIQLHPLTCTAFNADFDGDQMAVHLPITPEAQKEARNLMVTSKNMLNPSNGELIVSPTQDMILGCYYLTRITEWSFSGKVFSSIDDATFAYDNNVIGLHDEIKIQGINDLSNEKKDFTTYGRMIFNEYLPKSLWYQNDTMKNSVLKALLAKSFDIFGTEKTAKLCDVIKKLGFQYATQSGLSMSIYDMKIPEIKNELILKAEQKIKTIQNAQWKGLLTENERYLQSISVWSKVKTQIEKEVQGSLKKENHIYNFIDSKARGNWGQVTQLAGMKGLVASPSGKTIELPIKSNLREGFTTLEYFIATHGWRKGKADTALKTAQSGYMTRKLVDASQNILITENDCGTLHYETFNKNQVIKTFGESFEEKIYGKTTVEDIIKGDKVLLKKGEVIDKEILKTILEEDIQIVHVRTVITCEAHNGVCQKCYGIDLARDNVVEMWAPIGIVAAQSIGEPGTQLTMRTFHSGGVAKEGGDITQGLSRVEELFEARVPKYLTEMSTIAGIVESISYEQSQTVVTVQAIKKGVHEYYIGIDLEMEVKTGQSVKIKQVLARGKWGGKKIIAKYPGNVIKIEDGVVYIEDKKPRNESYIIPLGRMVTVSEGEEVEVGTPLCEGYVNPQYLMEIAGAAPTQRYLVNSIKDIYASQGQTVNPKHIELIVRQMFSKVRIIDSGETSFFPGDIIEISRFREENDIVREEGKKEAIAERLIMGITKIVLFTDSWLSAASFQETVRVLVEASVSGKIDKLEGLKNNVIIGRRIPALKYFYNNIHHPDDDIQYIDKKTNLEMEEKKDDQVVSEQEAIQKLGIEE